jgi:small conductance mechanosensitive channel
VQPPLQVLELLQVIANTTTITTVAAPAARPLWLVAADVVVALAGITLIGTLLTRLIRSVALRASAPKQIVSSVTQWMGVLIIVADAAAFTTLTGLSSSLTTLTLSGIGGLALSLALQNTLGNIISGVFLLNDGVIRLGDDVQFGGPGGVRGEIVKLSLRSTWLKTADGVITVIGNTNLAAGPIINYTARARLEKKLNI